MNSKKTKANYSTLIPDELQGRLVEKNFNAMTLNMKNPKTSSVNSDLDKMKKAIAKNFYMHNPHLKP